jgi:hypothetical protein
LRGYASESYEREILDLVQHEGDVSSREVAILYCGDFDPSGENIPGVFAEHTGLSIQRVALTPEQVAEYELPVAVGKETDVTVMLGACYPRAGTGRQKPAISRLLLAQYRPFFALRAKNGKAHGASHGRARHEWRGAGEGPA